MKYKSKKVYLKYYNRNVLIEQVKEAKKPGIETMDKRQLYDHVAWHEVLAYIQSLSVTGQCL